MSLKGKIAVVTGASRGIGRGIALQLGEAGAKVYVTGRDPKNRKIDPRLPTLESTAQEITQRGGEGIFVYVDSQDDDQIKNLFQRISTENNGRLDILVNNAFSAIDTDAFFGVTKFWEAEPDFWDSINATGLRSYYIASVYAARLFVNNKSGLIVNVSATGGKMYMFNVPFGVGKAGVDRMAADMAVELKPYNVAAVSLWPAGVNTELKKTLVADEKLPDKYLQYMKEKAKNDESPEYSGKAIVALAADPNIISKTGKILSTAMLGKEYGFKDIDGQEILPLPHVISLLNC